MSRGDSKQSNHSFWTSAKSVVALLASSSLFNSTALSLTLSDDFKQHEQTDVMLQHEKWVFIFHFSFCLLSLSSLFYLYFLLCLSLWLFFFLILFSRCVPSFFFLLEHSFYCLQLSHFCDFCDLFFLFYTDFLFLFSYPPSGFSHYCIFLFIYFYQLALFF